MHPQCLWHPGLLQVPRALALTSPQHSPLHTSPSRHPGPILLSPEATRALLLPADVFLLQVNVFVISSAVQRGVQG